jgi:hypothetical protein
MGQGWGHGVGLASSVVVGSGGLGAEERARAVDEEE